MNSLRSLWTFLILRGKDSLFQLNIQLFVMSEKDITAEQIVSSLDNMKKKIEYSLLYSAYTIFSVCTKSHCAPTADNECIQRVPCILIHFSYLLTYSMEQSPCEAKQFAASQEIPCIL